MQIVYAGEEFPSLVNKSLFLAGPTPRNQNVVSWRSFAIHILERSGYDGHVFVPERRDRLAQADYVEQVEWERSGLERADVVTFWVPRTLKRLPAFTTNVEFGRFISSGRVIYGRPEAAPNNRYLDWLYRKETGLTPCKTLEETIQASLSPLGDGHRRQGGETQVPLNVWKTPQFQQWYSALIKSGNRLDGATVLWTFGKPLFGSAITAKVWIANESRHKLNEFIISRPDISVVAAFCRKPKLADTEIILIQEFRTSVRNESGSVLELPGGSDYGANSPREVAAAELEQECGIRIEPLRLCEYGSRQLAATLSSHHSHLFAIELSEYEMEHVRRHHEGLTMGNANEDERTTVKILTLSQLREREDFDWSMLGMLYRAIDSNSIY